ncbi:MAG: glycosyltransferase, partial [Desulfovibrio sp.]
NGPVYEEMKDNAPDHVHILGLQSDVPSFLSIADMLLLQSMFRGESFPMVILEAWQAKIPVLATNLGDIPLMLLRYD